MSTPTLVVVTLSTMLIVVIAARLIAEHHRNKRNHIAAGTDRLLVRLSAQCNARPSA